MSANPISGQQIPRGSRRNILDLLSVEKVNWSGRLDEPSFLERIWDLSELPSGDHRFPDAAGDIWQHRINNWDWEDDWIFTDQRFDLLGCDDALFLHFLCEMVHPVVRQDPEEANTLVEMFNNCLVGTGWQIVPVGRLGDRRVYEPRAGDGAGAVAPLPVDDYPRLADPGVLTEHITRIEVGLADDPSAAIGSAKELVESVCKLILDDYNEDYKPADDVLDLYKKVAAVLSLNAESVPDSAKGSKSAQRSLRALVTTIQSLAELRNELGIGHGRAKKSPALTRHAKLAVAAARGVSEFLLETWHVRRPE